MRREELASGTWHRTQQLQSGDHVVEMGWRARSRTPELAAILHPADERNCPWEQGHDLAQQFLGFAPGSVRMAEVQVAPSALVVVGTLDAVCYSSKKWDRKVKRFVHEFGKDEGRRTEKPVLAVAPEGRPLYIVGGDYFVDERGIVG